MATSNPLDSLAAGDKASSAVAASISKKETETHKKRGREKCGSTLVSEGVASDHYKPITAYEGIHRYDPDFEWGPTEEKRIVRKVAHPLTRPHQPKSLTLPPCRLTCAFVPGSALCFSPSSSTAATYRKPSATTCLGV